ncbi:hypothetical protein, partial [Mitsuokella jalaludinii]|uniref:hypothetical protein n=1 Tax=Mitsuokella jalaludinii TaxID=187979 RepID=UPI002A91DF45
KAARQSGEPQIHYFFPCPIDGVHTKVTARDYLFFMLGQHIARLSAKKRINLLKKPKTRRIENKL